MKAGSNKQVMRRTTRETNRGAGTAGFSKTGKDGRKKGQFQVKTPGNREVGFKQWTEKTATAAMQGRPPQGGEVKARPKNNGSRQFTKAGGKAVF